jgi:uncharacterized protein YbjT (DUF2867 family)
METKKLIAVTGATGAQGGGLARAILSDPNSPFAVRAITRKTDSPNAVKLRGMGAEVVRADLDDPESLKKAFAGAHGAYCVTNYWEHMSPEREYAQAAAMAGAAKSAGMKHVIWSTFEDTRKKWPLDKDNVPTLMGKYKVPHFDSKAAADGEFTSRGIPVTFLYTSFYWENLIVFGMGPKKGPDGALAITFPMGDRKLPGMTAEDIGKCAYGIFKRGGEFIGKTVGVAGEHITVGQMASAMTKAFGREVRYNSVTPEAYRSFGFPGADDLGNMFQYKRDFETEFCAVRNLDLCRQLNPELMTFGKWLELNKGRITLE